MERVNIAEARERLEELIDRAAAGETIVIARDGQSAVRLEPEAAAADPNPPSVDWEQLARWIAEQKPDMRRQQEIIDEWKGRERY